MYFEERMGRNGEKLREVYMHVKRSRSIVQAFSRRLPTSAARVPGQVRSGHVGFVVDKVALGQVFSKYFGFSCQFSFHRLFHTHHISPGAGKIGQLVADGPHPKKLKIKYMLKTDHASSSILRT
jgi:hypothetical protein